MYGLGGERRLPEITLEGLHGYRGATPVRVGNAAAGQRQLDVYGDLLELSWRWHQRGHSPDDDLWRFLVDLVDKAAELWSEPDHGIWELRGEPRHFTHSKVRCWSALEFGLRLADECERQAPRRRWEAARASVRREVEHHGYDSKRGVFIQAFGSDAVDASLLRLPVIGFVAWADERMVRTTDLIIEELNDHGLIQRYRTPDGLAGEEGTFLACTFWLAECLAHQGRHREAREWFDRAAATANDLGLFSEEVDPATGELLGNFPQALTHLSHVTAAIALHHCGAEGLIEDTGTHDGS
jgi:GH15 family glucan-1,4-alpha-glucosidase